MKRTVLIAAFTLAVAPAFASEIDCFPMCAPESATAAEPPPRLCDAAIVQEGMKLNRELASLRQAYEIATDPTGFAIREATKAAGIEVPKVVGIALNPKGALKAEVMKRVREEAKKRVGLDRECKA
jgi:hypothetical protein